MAKICETIANVQGNKTTAADFMPNFQKHTQEQSEAEIGAKLQAFFGGKPQHGN